LTIPRLSYQRQNGQELALGENVPEQAEMLQSLNLARGDMMLGPQSLGAYESLPRFRWIFRGSNVGAASQQRFRLGMREQK
jgi:hypothetical protein